MSPQTIRRHALRVAVCISLLSAPAQSFASSIGGIGGTGHIGASQATRQVIFGLGVTAIAAADLDGDDLDEWVAATPDGTFLVRSQDGSKAVLGTRRPVTSLAVIPATPDRDGGVVATFARGGIAVYGTDREALLALADDSIRARGSSVFDFEGDGLVELVGLDELSRVVAIDPAVGISQAFDTSELSLDANAAPFPEPGTDPTPNQIPCDP